MKNYDKFIDKAAFPILIAAGILMIFVTIQTTQSTNRENNGYIRVINCVISTPATSRGQVDIEHCYKTVEADLGIKLQRYDNTNYGN